MDRSALRDEVVVVVARRLEVARADHREVVQSVLEQLTVGRAARRFVQYLATVEVRVETQHAHGVGEEWVDVRHGERVVAADEHGERVGAVDALRGRFERALNGRDVAIGEVSVTEVRDGRHVTRLEVVSLDAGERVSHGVGGFRRADASQDRAVVRFADEHSVVVVRALDGRSLYHVAELDVVRVRRGARPLVALVHSSPRIGTWTSEFSASSSASS